MDEIDFDYVLGGVENLGHTYVGQCCTAGHKMPPIHSQRLVLKNHQSSIEIEDRLHISVQESGERCMTEFCLGSVVNPNHGAREALRSLQEVKAQAKDFIREYFASLKTENSSNHIERWNKIEQQIDEEEFFDLTESELLYGAKLAWRNASKCIGRIQWNKLHLFDARHATTTQEMFEAICHHIEFATNKGNLRSGITVFPPRRKGRDDFRVWNPQLLGYAGYKNPDGSITGDSVNVEFTQICESLGWKGEKTDWDILPIVVSAGGEPEVFDIPQELVLQVQIVHPKHDWFGDLGLRWYALPAVSGMMFDCAGMQFTACPFNGWYMGTEVGCRDLADVHRYNVLPKLAMKLDLDSSNPTTLWQDMALVELNLAVLYSFQKAGVTIVDHHTASEQFMTHYATEFQTRGGCPADWVWIVPPMSSSLCPVFHQEMVMYSLKPSYEYQESAWSRHLKKINKEHKKWHFKEIVYSIIFVSGMFNKVLESRVKATILYATETRKSEIFAKQLGEIFSKAFNVTVLCMEDYDIEKIQNESILLAVASTFGNGDPPENGQKFAHALYSIKVNCGVNLRGCDMPRRYKNFMKRNSSLVSANSINLFNAGTVQLKRDRTESVGTISEVFDDLRFDEDGPLRNVTFGVFGLGSSAYPNFGAFGHYVDNLFCDLGGQRLLKMQIGDELAGQKRTFDNWSQDIFKVTCERFNIKLNDTLQINENPTDQNIPLSSKSVRFIQSPIPSTDTLLVLNNTYNRVTSSYQLMERNNLHPVTPNMPATIHLVFKCSKDEPLEYTAGDHIGVFIKNSQALVESLLKRFENTPEDIDTPVQLQILNPNNGGWKEHEQLPTVSIRELFTRYLNITSPPCSDVLKYLKSCTENQQEIQRLQQLIDDKEAYDEWKTQHCPHQLMALEQFPGVKPDIGVMASLIPILQPRLYSVSSSPLHQQKDEIHLTVSVVAFDTPDGNRHHGVATSYLNSLKLGTEVYCFVRSAPGFQMPESVDVPIILIGAGSGIAPFRGFWQEINENCKRKMILFFGCRTKEMVLYKVELEELQKCPNFALHVALSRETGLKKTYVQHLLEKEGAHITKLVSAGAHIYVCGDPKMAEDVYDTFIRIAKDRGKMSYEMADDFMMNLRDENRYHEDIFGILPKKAVSDKQNTSSTPVQQNSNDANGEIMSNSIKQKQDQEGQDYRKPKKQQFCWACFTCKSHSHDESGQIKKN